MVSHWSLSDSESPQVSRTLLSILPGLNNTIFWIVFTRPLISKSSCPCTNPLVTVPRTPFTIGVTVTLMFHSFFSSLARSRYLSVFVSFCFTLWSAGTAKSTIQLDFFFKYFFTITTFGHLAQVRWSICISKPQRILCISFSKTDYIIINIIICCCCLFVFAFKI